MVPIVPKITNFDECKPPDFMRFELDKSDLVLSVNGKIWKETAIGAGKGGAGGFFGTFAYHAVDYMFNSGKKTWELIFKQAVILGGSGAAVGAFLGRRKGWEEVERKNLSIERDWSASLQVSVERCRDIINAFLEDESFIAENPRAEVTCRITHTLIIHPIKLRCDHVFSHIEITEWVQRNRSCPTCRTPSEERDFQYSYHTTIKVSFVVKRIFQRLRRSSAPDGIDVKNANEVLDPIFQAINQFNDNVNAACLKHITKKHLDHFDQMSDILRDWKNRVDIKP